MTKPQLHRMVHAVVLSTLLIRNPVMTAGCKHPGLVASLLGMRIGRSERRGCNFCGVT